MVLSDVCNAAIILFVASLPKIVCREIGAKAAGVYDKAPWPEVALYVIVSGLSLIQIGIAH